jgi:predicted ATPase
MPYGGVIGLLSPHEGELALKHAEQGIALYDLEQHHTQALQYGHDPGICCLQVAAKLLWLLGYPDQASQRSQAALRLAHQLPQSLSLAFTLGNDADLHIFRRELDVAHAQTSAALALEIEQGNLLGMAIGSIRQGWLLAMQDDPEEGIVKLRQGIAGWKAVGAVLHRPLFLQMLAEAYAKAGQIEAGLAAVDEALATATANNDHFWDADIHRLHGELLLAAGRMADQAEAALQQALRVARQQKAKILELRAAMSLARLWQQQERVAEAQQLLAEIYGWFTEGFDTVDLKVAKALLDELQGDSASD